MDVPFEKMIMVPNSQLFQGSTFSFSNLDVGIINGPPLQGQQGQQGLRLEVSERPHPTNKGDDLMMDDEMRTWTMDDEMRWWIMRD